MENSLQQIIAIYNTIFLRTEGNHLQKISTFSFFHRVLATLSINFTNFIGDFWNYNFFATSTICAGPTYVNMEVILIRTNSFITINSKPRVAGGFDIRK